VIATLDIASAPSQGTASQAYASVLEQLYARAASSFAESTLSGLHPNAQEQSVDRTSVSLVADPELLAEYSDAPELRAIEELRTWLRLTYREVSRVAGLSSPSLLHHWRERHRSGQPVHPRASTIEHLWQVHSVVRAISEALEGAGHSYAVQLWVRDARHGETPLETLLKGDVAQVERLARGLLFSRDVKSSPARTVAVEEDRDLEPAAHPVLPTYSDSDFG
jgi:hypothetical protein